MPNLRIGVRTARFGTNLRAALAEAGRLEADGVEIDLRDELPLAELSQTALRQIRKWLDDYRLRLAAVRFPTRRGLGDPSDLDRRVAAIERAMQCGFDLGARLIVLPGAVSQVDNSCVANAALLESLQRLARRSEHVGVQVALQAATIDPQAAGELLRDLPQTLIGWALDPAALATAGQEVTSVVTHLASHWRHAYASDGYRDFATRQFVATELGRGTIDLAEMLGILDGAGYAGWWVVEPATGAASGPASLADAVAFLRNL